MLLVFALMVARPTEDCLAGVDVHELQLHCASKKANTS